MILPALTDDGQLFEKELSGDLKYLIVAGPIAGDLRPIAK